VTSKSVRESLLEDPGSSKVVCLNDGSRVVVRTRERWLAAPDKLVVLDDRGRVRHLAHHDIAEITFVKTNGHRGKKQSHGA
jgi:hypothetical protein